MLTTHTAEPGSAAEEKLRLLASWTAPARYRQAGTRTVRLVENGDGAPRSSFS
jgi:hypothetical protein